MGFIRDIMTARADEARARADHARARARAESARAEAEAARAQAESARVRALTDVAGAARVALSGGYDSAARSRLNNKSVPASGSANAFLDPTTRKDMRKWCRDLERNSIVARGLIQAHQDAVVGDGGVVTPTTRDAEWNQAAALAFRAWCENEDPAYYGPAEIAGVRSFWECVSGVVQAFAAHGDELWVQVVDPDSKRLTLQCIPGEQVINPGGETAADRRSLIGGVELTEYGRPVAFHVAQYDETGSFLTGTPRRIPATSARLLVNPRLARTGQVRGEPGLQAVAKRIDQIDQFIQHTGYAAQVATLFGLLIKTADPATTQNLAELATDDQPDRSSAYAPKEIELGPGFVNHLRPGESVEQVKPEHPTTQFRDFVLTNLLIVSADMGIPMPVWLYEIGSLTASNLKALMGLAWRRLARQQDYLTHRAISWMYRAKIRDFIDAGILLENDEWDRHRVILPHPPVMDFKTEAEGLALAVEKNLLAKGDATRMLGTGEFEDIADERGRERDLERELGISPPELPGAKTDGANGEAPIANREDGTGAEDGVQGGEQPGAAAGSTAAAKPPADGAASGYLVGDKTLAADMVKSVAAGAVPAASATAILTTMVGVTPDQAQQIIGPAESFTPKAAEPSTTAEAAPAGDGAD